MAQLDKRYSYSGSNVEYIGEARPGTSPGSSAWRIRKITYDGSNNPLLESWAGASDAFDKAWNVRGSYTYITS